MPLRPLAHDARLAAAIASLVALTVLPGVAAAEAVRLANPFSDGNDREENTTVVVLTQGRDFGAGDDLFTNKGTLRFDRSDRPLNLAFTSLERFANDGGLIDMRNGRAGDVFSLSGAYAASGDARLGLDIDANAADSLVIGGGATGRTSLVLNVAPADARLRSKGFTVVTVGSSSSSTAFVVANPDQGLVRYALAYDATSRTYVLNAAPGLAVRQALRAGEGLNTAWRASTDAFAAEQAMARAAGGDRGRVWVQAHGGRLDRKTDGAVYDLAYDQTTAGGQMGASLGARDFGESQAAFGLTGGYVESRLGFDDGGLAANIETFNLGAYAAWRSAGLFGTALVKADRHRVRISSDIAGLEGDLDGTSWGGQLEAGYRIALEGGGFEPIIGLDYVRSAMDDLDVLGQRIAFDDRGGLAARVGAQGFIRHDLAEGQALTVSLGLEAVQDFDTEQSGRLVSGGQTETVRLQGPKTFARTRFALQFQARGGLQTFLQGEGRFGESQLGGALRMGARYRF